jgi:pimeloyl-ACP methyl ester carboxylesterase
MKLTITFLVYLFFGGFIFAQDHAFDLLKSDTKTKILYDQVFPISKATTLDKSKVNSNQYLQVYHEIQRADFLERLPKLDFLQKCGDEGFNNNYIPLSLLITDFENINPEAIQSQKVILNSKKQYQIKDQSEPIFQENHLSLMGSLLGKTKARSVQFLLKKDLVFNTTDRVLSFVEVKEKTVWRKINFDEIFTLNFPENGLNTVHYKIHFIDGNVLSQSFVIDVQYQKRATDGKGTVFQPNIVTNISSTIPYKGYGETAAFLGKGEYEVFLDTVNGVLDQPIILIDGFDPGDSRNTSAIYQLLNYGNNQNLGDVIRAQGYDVIVLNFPTYTRDNSTTIIDGGVDYIQRNAMILVELLKKINTQKVGSAKNVVIGPSMGGLISRYALRYMEQNTLNPDTRLFISFDSPHLGANVPLGFQHLFNYMGFGPLGDVTLQGIVKGLLKSPAAKEMLIDHFEGHLKSGDAVEFDPAKLLPVGAPNYRSAFQNELNAMGFPTTTRNVAISNGAGNSTMTGTPGMIAMDHTFNSSSTQRAIIKVNYTPIKNTTLEISNFKAQQWIFFWFTGYESAASAKSSAVSDGLDSAPGGRFNMGEFAASTGGNPLLTEFVDNLKIKYFNFIPAISSLAISNTSNYYAPINSLSTTPFAAYSVPTINEDHVTFNSQNVQFALNEILNSSTLSTVENNLIKSIWIENPVKNMLKIKSTSLLKDAQISVLDASGKKVLMTKKQNIQGTVEFPLHLENGIYIVTINFGKAQISKKLIVNK